MAGDKKTILDVVKNVDQKDRYNKIRKVRKLQENYRYGSVPGEEELSPIEKALHILPPYE